MITIQKRSHAINNDLFTAWLFFKTSFITILQGYVSEPDRSIPDLLKPESRKGILHDTVALEIRLIGVFPDQLSVNIVLTKYL